MRRFQVADPFGRTWDVEFRWQQNAISIRHADAVDCKYYISCGDEKRELVVALRHPDLLRVAAERGSSAHGPVGHPAGEPSCAPHDLHLGGHGQGPGHHAL